MHRKLKFLRKNRGKFLVFFFKNWWVALFSALAFALYFQASQRKDQLAFSLEEGVVALKKERERALKEKEELELRIESEKEDIELTILTLKKKLGMVEEGETKVIFIKRT